MSKEEAPAVPKESDELSSTLYELEVKKTADTADIFLQREEQKARIESFRQDTEERKVYARATFKLIRAYLIVVAAFLFLVGVVPLPFHFSDAIVITLLSTTTTTVIGVFLLVMQYLFQKRDNKSQ